MLAKLFTRTPGGALLSSRHSRRRLALVAFLVTVCYAVTFAFHFVTWRMGTPPETAVLVMYHIAAIACFGGLWLLLSSILRQRHAPPSKIFWTTFLISLLFLVLSWLIGSLGLPPEMEVEARNLGFEHSTGAPLALATVLKTTVLSLLRGAFAFFLLLRFRELVLFKRTRQSQRNWYLMLGSMAVASIFAFMKPPTSEYDAVIGLAIIPAIGLMVVNSFRLSWIVLLSFKEKVLGIGLSMALLGLLALAVRTENIVPGAINYVRHYSYPLEVFTTLSIGFGVLYCTTAFLSLLFHLPTTVDFQRKASEVTAMHSLTHLIGQVFDPDKLYFTVAASPVEAGSAHQAWLAVADPASGSLRPRIVSSVNITMPRVAELVDSMALYDEVASRREPLLLEEAPGDHRIFARPGDGLGSLLVTPLIARDVLLGALFVTREVTHGFEKDDIEAISVFAAQAALALDNARLFSQQVEKERLTRELDIAREVQRKLLPQRLPDVAGLRLAASSVSAHEVGGDYYDFLQIDEHRLAFIVADVSGKGTSAAFYMAELQGIFQATSPLTPSPAVFLTHANRAISRALERHVFISVIYSVLDLRTEELVIARGGHCPAVMIDSAGEARFIRTRGLGLGLDRTELFERTLSEEVVRLKPGDTFVFYTDGIVESRNALGEEYGYDRLLEALCRNNDLDAVELHAALLADLDDFLDRHEYDDDLTLVVVKWHGVHAGAEAAGAGISKAADPVHVA